MIAITEFRTTETADLPVQDQSDELNTQTSNRYQTPNQSHLPGQMLRFGLVGSLNTLVDLLILNGLLWLFPTTSTLTLLMYNVLAYSLGAINSFLLNKYWTFGYRQRTTWRELVRFALTTLGGIGWSSTILWLASSVLHPVLVNPIVWANVSKVLAIAGTALISYLGMRLWVFVHCSQKSDTVTGSFFQTDNEAITRRKSDIDNIYADQHFHDSEKALLMTQSLSVVLPVYNEESVIAATIEDVLNALPHWVRDYEVILVNDGSSDRTGDILAAIASSTPQVRVITHERNQGYGAALADGFTAASGELAFFMDADGQFDIHDLPRLLTFINEYDAVIGYRVHRQDTWMRKLNAWGWKTLIGIVLDVHVRDIDCAFKLLHTDFIHHYAPETQGAMINAEMLYKLTHAGYTYREVAVRHRPRHGGKATGANFRVIARAFRELFIYARKWRGENSARVAHAQVSH